MDQGKETPPQDPPPQAEPREIPRILGAFSAGLTAIGCTTLALMMIHITADVVLKYVLGKPLSGTLEIVSHYYMVITIFAPLALVEVRREAIVVDAFFPYYPRRSQAVFIGIALVIAMAVYAAFAWQTTLDALHAVRIGERAMGAAEVPIWPARWIMPVAFCLAALVGLSQFVALLRGRNPELAHPHNPETAIREI